MKIYEYALKKLSDWYNFEWDTGTPNLFVINDQETFHAIAGEKTEDWLSGFSDYCNNIFIYSLEAQKKFTMKVTMNQQLQYKY